MTDLKKKIMPDFLTTFLSRKKDFLRDKVKKEVVPRQTTGSPSVCFSGPYYALNLSIFRREIKGE